MLALVASLIFLLQGFQGAISVDSSLYAYAGFRVADGIPPYVAVFNRAGPLAHLVPGMAVIVGQALGVGGLLAMRIVMAAASALCVWLVYLVGREVFGSRIAGVTAASALLVFDGFVIYATYGPREKTLMLLFLVLVLWLGCRRRWWLTGAAIALVTLTWQGAFFPAAATALVLVIGEGGIRAKLGALLRVGLGGLLVTATTVAYFVAVGAFAEFYEGFLGAHLSGHAGQTGLWNAPGRWGHVANGLGWSRWVLVAGVAALVVLVAVRLRHIPRGAARDYSLLGLGAGLLTCVGWSLLAFQGWPDVLIFLPFAALGIGGAVHLLATALPGRTGQVAAAALVVVLLADTAASAVANRSTALLDQREIAQSMVDAADPGARIQVIGTPIPLALLGMRNPIRYTLFQGGVAGYLRAKLPAGLHGLVRDIERRRPTYLVVNKRSQQRWLLPVLERSYLRLGDDGSRGIWYVTDTVPEDQVRQMRALLTRGRSRNGAASVQRSLP